MYDETEEGVLAKALDANTPVETKGKVTKLHNIIKTLFYETNHTPFELTITFDSKKINIDAIDDIHRLIRVILQSYSLYFNWFVIREWSNQGTGRLHYHGIINQVKGGQTMMAKLKANLKRTFGKDCRIGFITYFDSYIPYILKRIIEEEDLLQSEWISSFMIHSYYITDEYDETKYYTYSDLLDYKNKRTKKGGETYRKYKK